MNDVLYELSLSTQIRSLSENSFRMLIMTEGLNFCYHDKKCTSFILAIPNNEKLEGKHRNIDFPEAILSPQIILYTLKSMTKQYNPTQGPRTLKHAIIYFKTPHYFTSIL